MKKKEVDFLTYEEIQEKFSDEWIILLDIKLDKNNDRPVKGRVVFHSKSMEKAYKALESYKSETLAFYCTGDIPEDMGVLLHRQSQI